MRAFTGFFLVALLAIAPACGGDPISNECSTAAECDDSDPCTVDSCSEAGACEHTDLDCDDGLFCNGPETCDPTGGCQDGTPPVIDDGVACTDDSCDEINGVVVNEPNHGTCDDGVFCNGPEVCDPTDGCQDGTAPVIDDGVACTDDSCDEVNGVVVNTPVDGNCDDGQFCNGVETCDAVADCQAGTAPVADDGVACTDETCDEVNDVIVSTANDANCDDGQFCNGTETCNATTDCQAGTPPVADDGVGCTDEICDETNDVINSVANDGNCDDGQFCNGAETCNATTDCQAGTTPTLDDGVTCTDDSCDEVNDVVVHAPNHGFCADSDVCTTDTCDVVSGCQTSTAPACNNCNSSIGGNGSYDLQGSLPSAGGTWADQGVIDEFVLTAPSTEFCSIEFYFVPPPASTEFDEVEIRIYDLGSTGIAGLGNWNTAPAPVFTQLYSIVDGSLLISATGDAITTGVVDGDILHYQAVGTLHDLGPGNYGLFIWFPNATVQWAGWTTAASSGPGECMTGWGPTQPTGQDACIFLGGVYQNAAFELFGL